jgi:DNA processing protein
MTSDLWQALLLAEMPIGKGRALLRELGPFGDEAVPRLLRHPSLTEKEMMRLASFSSEKVSQAVAQGVQPITSSDYPETLNSWEFAPIGIFGWGDWKTVFAPTISIVGTRGASTYGKAVAMKFAEAFARAGVTVVSGGALGIDASAHKGAMQAKGKTVAVLAGGVDRPYPALHRGLFQQIRESGGCVVSQFACGTPPNDYKFLIRNHLIAALSLAVLVVEAPERSGSLHTAFRANEMGRQVFVVPSNIENQNFRGSHALIRDGATLVDHPGQVLESIGVTSKPAEFPAQVLQGTAAKIVATLSTTPLAMEFILERTGLPMSEVVSELTMLELEGRIFRDGGGYAVKP